MSQVSPWGSPARTAARQLSQCLRCPPGVPCQDRRPAVVSMSQVSPWGPLPGPPRWPMIFFSGPVEIMSWMQQREAIRRAADAGARPRISAQGSQLLPLRDNRLQSVLLTRPNGQLTRAEQFYHSITGRRPPSRQFDESQPLIRDGPNDYILTGGGARKLVTASTTSLNWGRPSSRTNLRNGWPMCP